MAVKNSIAPKQEQKKTEIEYLANGESVKLSPAAVRRYLVNGGGNVTDEEVGMFLSLCRYQHLNPFIREAYLIKYGDRQPATMVVGKDVFVKRARRHPEFDGLQAGIIVLDAETGNIGEREGTFYIPEREKLVGGWAKVWIKGYKVPIYASVPLGEYIGRKSNGEINGQWAGKPATMIRKVALSQALKEAFPEDGAGLYVQEEIPEAQAVVLDETAVLVPEEQPAEEMKPEPAKEEKQTEAPAEDPEAALFG